MKNVVIRSGKVTEIRKNADGVEIGGNLTGYTAKGQRIHVHGAQLKAIGLDLKPGDSITKPLYAIVDFNREIDSVDDDGNVVKTIRPTAMSVFLNKEDLAAAYAEDVLLDGDVATEVTKQATAAGLSAEAVAALLDNAAQFAGLAKI